MAGSSASLDHNTLAILKEAMSLSENEIQQYYTRFKRDVPDGRPNAFLSYVSKVSSSDKLHQQAKQFFELFDKNHDGTLSKSEVLNIVKSVFRTASDRGVPLLSSPEKVTDDFFGKLDADGNHEISKDEFIQGILSEPDMLRILKNPEVMNDLRHWRLCRSLRLEI